YGGVLYQQYGKNAFHSISLMGTPFEQVLYQIFSVVAVWIPDLPSRSNDIVGGFGSFSFFGISFLDPVIAVETFMRSRDAWATLLGASVLVLVIAVLLGRVFCGWICPINTLLEGIDLLRSRLLPRLGLKTLDWAAPRWLKWVLFLGGVSVSVVMDIALWAQLLPHVQIGRDIFSLIFFGTLTAGASVLAVIIFAELFLSRRIWCRSLCPTGAVLGFIGALAPLRLRKALLACRTGCTACTGACPMALNPAEPIAQAECLNCGICLSVCPEELLSLAPVRTKRGGYEEIIPALRRFTFLIVGGLMAVFATLAVSPAAAHHMRSQPHYGYAESYPQIPTKETRAHIGNYDVVVVSYFFEGLRRERSDTPDDVQFYIGLMNAKTLQSYAGPLSIELWKGGKRIVNFEHAKPFEEAAYRIRQKVSGPGRYILRLAVGDIRGEVAVDVEGKSSSFIPYVVSVGAVLLATLFFLNRRRRINFRRPEETHVASGS
ncbi:MAG: 4Fe-4S binding protein, partial [Nitrospinaceae bacterium]|nr:4Fe-4S binding protein [Nitrospinaceae bacterium]